MFRRLIMAIFRLYMKYLLSSYTKHTWAVYISVFHAMLVASTVVTVKCAATPSGWLIHTDVSEEPAFINRVMDASVHI